LGPDETRYSQVLPSFQTSSQSYRVCALNVLGQTCSTRQSLGRPDLPASPAAQVLTNSLAVTAGVLSSTGQVDVTWATQCEANPTLPNFCSQPHLNTAGGLRVDRWDAVSSSWKTIG